MPIRIVEETGSNKGYYSDKITVLANTARKIETINLSYEKEWLTEEEKNRIAIQKQKEEENRQAIAKTIDTPLSVYFVSANIDKNSKTTSQISEFRKSTYGKYIGGVGFVSDVQVTGKSYTIYVLFGDRKTPQMKKGYFNAKLNTTTDMSKLSLWQKVKFKGEFGPSSGDTTGEYIHLYKCEVELLK
jgi:hypothetical protein